MEYADIIGRCINIADYPKDDFYSRLEECFQDGFALIEFIIRDEQTLSMVLVSIQFQSFGITLNQVGRDFQIILMNWSCGDSRKPLLLKLYNDCSPKGNNIESFRVRRT